MNTLLSSVYPLLGTFTMPKAARDKASGGDGAGGVMDNDLFSWMIIGLAITSIVTFGAFVIWELTDSHPVVDLRVLRHRSLNTSLIYAKTDRAGLVEVALPWPGSPA